ncbi:vexin [Tachyglossus aculeatus]|uniref:vexin n=1 Tax=Tachyglossus aculeatus TaxID=9261 RepID=UPI0018F7CC18|nr:vexin [Tachyglossus aculeatus]
MQQIYSCSDENLEVFTTVIASKVSSPSRRKVKSSQHILTKSMGAIPDYHGPGTMQLLPYPDDHVHAPWRDEDGRRFVRLQNGSQSFLSAKCPSRHVGISESKSSTLCGNQVRAKFLVSQTPPPGTRIIVKQPATPATAKEPRRASQKIPEDDSILLPGAEASLPLTGSTSYGTPGLLRKMWMKHKKKSEYMGATNNAFEAD